MPSLSEVIAFRKSRYEASMALIQKKGHDYNRQQQAEGDTLFNLKVAEILGIVPTTERGILVRLSDKFMRLISLTAPGVSPANVEESVLDTINDLHNYVDYLGLIWQQRQLVSAIGGPAPASPWNHETDACYGPLKTDLAGELGAVNRQKIAGEADSRLTKAFNEANRLGR